MAVLGLAYVMNQSAQTSTLGALLAETGEVFVFLSPLLGQEGVIFRKVLGWSLVLLLLMCVIVLLQSTSVLGWMVP